MTDTFDQGDQPNREDILEFLERRGAQPDLPGVYDSPEAIKNIVDYLGRLGSSSDESQSDSAKDRVPPKFAEWYANQGGSKRSMGDIRKSTHGTPRLSELDDRTVD